MHPAVEHAIEVSRDFFPAQTECADQSLATLLRAHTAAEAPDDAWSFSRLAYGFPVEWMFTSDQDGIRYTVDIAAASRQPQTVLTQALEHLHQLDGTVLPEAYHAFFHDIQRRGRLKYGSWIGARHTSAGNEFKLYIEIPPGAGEDAVAWLNRQTPYEVPFYERPISSRCRTKLDLIGYNPGNGQLESYFSTVGLLAWELSALLAPLGLQDAREPVMDLLQEAYELPIYQDFPSVQMGFSYAFLPGIQTAVFSLYTFAAAMFGGDARVRQGILRLGRKRGWNMDYYAQASQSLANATGTTCTHGLFGIACALNRDPALYLGLRPPEPQ